MLKLKNKQTKYQEDFLNIEDFKIKLLPVLIKKIIIIDIIGIFCIFIFDDIFKAEMFKFFFVISLFAKIFIKIFEPKLKLNTKAIIFITSFLLGTLLAIYVWDVIGIGVILLFVSSIFSILFFNLKQTFLINISSTFLVIIIFYFKNPFFYNQALFTNNIYNLTWILQILCYLFFSTIIILIINGFKEIIISNFKSITFQKSELNRIQNNNIILFDQAADGILITNPEGILINANKVICKLTEYSKEELMGKHINFVFTENSLIEFPIQFEIINTGETIRNENFIKTKSGKIIPIEMTSRKLSDGRYQAFFRDITERVKSQKMLQSNEERFRNIMLAAFDGIVVLNADKIMEANEVFVKMISYSYSEISEMSFFDFVTESSKLILKNNINEKQEITYEIDLITKEKKIINVEIRAKNLILLGKEARVTFIRDITERKKKDVQLFKYQNHLKDIVSEQTKELKEKHDELISRNIKIENQNQVLEKAFVRLENTKLQLIQSEKMASLGTLTAGLAHEINNPINFISNGIEGLNEHLSDIINLLNKYRNIDKNNVTAEIESIKNIENQLEIEYSIATVEKMNAIIHAGVTRTVEIVKSLRNFSSFDNNLIMDVNVHENIDNTLVMLYYGYKDKVEIVKKFHHNLPQIKSNSGKINQIIMNILSNAVQSINESGTIFIETGVDLQKNNIFVSIKDTGIGISHENITKIYDPFFTTKEIGKGIGIGLSIVYNFITELKGSIDVKSTENVGTEFIITLPIK